LSWAVAEGEVEAGQIEGPSYLSAVQLSCGHEILQILVVYPDLYWMSSAFQEMSSLL